MLIWIFKVLPLSCLAILCIHKGAFTRAISNVDVANRRDWARLLKLGMALLVL
jgi:hypothetical protein